MAALLHTVFPVARQRDGFLAVGGTTHGANAVPQPRLLAVPLDVQRIRV
jgi:hypothetical protein